MGAAILTAALPFSLSPSPLCSCQVHATWKSSRASLSCFIKPNVSLLSGMVEALGSRQHLCMDDWPQSIIFTKCSIKSKTKSILNFCQPIPVEALVAFSHEYRVFLQFSRESVMKSSEQWPYSIRSKSFPWQRPLCSQHSSAFPISSSAMTSSLAVKPAVSSFYPPMFWRFRVLSLLFDPPYCSENVRKAFG